MTKSRATRFTDACADATSAVDDLGETVVLLQEKYAHVVEAFERIKEVQEEYNDWRENMPEGLDQSPTAEKLDAIINIDLEVEDELEVNLDELREKIDEAEQADFPLGFGRD